jgi:hypothetical protein
MSVDRSEAIEVQVVTRSHSGGGGQPIVERFVSISRNRTQWKSLPVESPITIVEALAFAAAIIKLEDL